MLGRRSTATALRLAAVVPAALLLLLPLSAAAETNVRLRVDRATAQVGDPVQVTVEIQIDGRSSYDEFFAPPMKDFQVQGGGMTSQNIEVINWRVRRRETRTFSAIPLRPGKLRIGPAAVRVGARTVRSGTVTIDVRGAGAAPPPGSPGALGQTGGGPGPGPGQPLSSVFVFGSVTPAQVYVGQQVIGVWELYSQSDVIGYQPIRQPSTDGFWTEDIRSPRRLQFQRKLIQGRSYLVATVLRRALFPQREGKLTIGPLSTRIRTMAQFGSSAIARQSQPLEVEVLPLPQQGRPADFPLQNVGKLTISARVDRQQAKVGEAIKLTIVVNGTGNLRQMKVGELGALSGAKVYEPKVSERLRRDNGISGDKIVEYLLLPTKPGRLKIPSVAIDFFDPEAKRYERRETRPIEVRIGGSELRGGASTPRDGQQNVLARDIRPPRSPAALSDRGARGGPLGGVPLWLFILPLALFVGITGADRVRAHMSRQTARSLSRAAARRVREHLRQADEAQRAADPARMFSELSAAVLQQLNERLGVRTEGLTRDELRDAMLAGGFDGALSGRVIDELDNCDFGRFARSATDDGSLGQAVARVRGLIDELVRARLGGGK